MSSGTLVVFCLVPLPLYIPVDSSGKLKGHCECDFMETDCFSLSALLLNAALKQMDGKYSFLSPALSDIIVLCTES